MDKIDPQHRSFRLTPNDTLLCAAPLGAQRKAFRAAIVQQAGLFVLSGSLLDLVVVFRRVLVAMIVYWCFVLLVLLRRRKELTGVDLLLVKYGIWPLLATTGLVARWLGT